MTYDSFEHRHRFAVWAGARAAQRGFTKVEVLREALESTTIRSFLLNPASLETDSTKFAYSHREWCTNIVEYLEEKGVQNVTYGRAAKLVAVYLKAMVVVGPDSQSLLARVAHPPIDRILLHNLATSQEVISAHKAHWKGIAWTTLNKDSYYELIDQLQAVVPHAGHWWTLEKYWTVNNE